MKKNNLLKVLSAAAIVSTLSTAGLINTQHEQTAYAANEVTSKPIDVPSTLQHYYENRPSMGNGALHKVTVQKVGDQYKYTVIWKDLTFAGKNDGVSKFWVEGKQVELTPTSINGLVNPRISEFTLSELKSKIEVEVFVQVMEDLSPGGGRQKAYLQLDVTKAKEEFNKSTKPVEGTNPAVTPGEKPAKPTTPPTQGLVDHVADSSIVPKEFPATAKGSFKQAGSDTKDSAYNAALDSDVRIEKVGDKYKYTFKIHPGTFSMGGNAMNFELEEILYKDKVLDTKVLDAEKKIKEVTLTTSELFDKIQLKGATTYPGMGKMTHPMTFALNFNKKNDLSDYNISTDKNIYQDVPYTKELKKQLPITVQGHFRNAIDNKEESLYNAALDHDVKVEKVGDKYHYTIRVKPGVASVGGELYAFELSYLQYKDVTLAEKKLTPSGKIREITIVADKLLQKIQLTGANVYPGQKNPTKHDTTLELYYETARDFVEKPVVEEKPTVPTKPAKPTTPTKPEENKKPEAPAVPDHEVVYDKIPNTLPTTVKGELKYQKDNSQLSTYANLFEKDVTVEKVGDKYKYTFKVKEEKGNTFITKRTNFQFSKIVHNGTEATITNLEKTQKEVSFTTDKLLDKIQLKATVVSKQNKDGNEVDVTLDLNFPDSPAEFLKGGKVAISKDGAYAIFFDNDNSTPVNVTIPVAGLDKSVKELAVEPKEVPGIDKKDNSIFDIHFLTKNGEVKQIKQAAKVSIPVDREVVEAYHINEDGSNKEPLKFENKVIDGKKYVEVEAKHFSLIGIKFATINNNGNNGNNGNNENNGPTIENTATIFEGVTAKLMHAHQPGRPSMGNAALDRVQVYEQNGVYHYVVYFKNIKFLGQTDGITRFWVNGTEYPLYKTGGADNEVRAHFTSNQKLTQVPVAVFVQTMENIMPGGGKQNAILTFDWSNVREVKGKAPDTTGGTPLTGGAGTLNPNGKRLARTGLDTTSSIFAGIITLAGAVFLGRKKQK